MEGFKIIKLSDIPPISEAELKAQEAKERKEYLKMLRELCPSKEMRQEAKRISKRKTSCDTCVYCDGESWICWYPHSDIYMEALNIDHCYEGVLRYLVEETQNNNSSDFIDKEEAALIDAPVCLQEMIYRENETINILSKYILEMAYKNNKPTKDILDSIRNLYDATKDALPYFERLFAKKHT